MTQAQCAVEQELRKKWSEAARERAAAAAALHDLKRFNALTHTEQVASEAYKKHLAVCPICKATMHQL